MKQKRFLSMFALLLMAATGAWAQTETLLTTITPTGFSSYSETTAGVVTVTPSGQASYNPTYGWLWDGSGSLTVEAKEGYTITRCVFKQNSKTPVTITTSPFAITFAFGTCEQDPYGEMDGVTSIEVYGYAPAPAPGYSVTLAEGTEDGDKWTVKVGEGEAKAFPVEGLNGGETVTVTYSGEKKVKSVKAVKKALDPAKAYMTWDADQKELVATEIPTTATKVENADGNVSWAGTYVVEDDVTISGTIGLSGEVDLIIKDGATLTAQGIGGSGNTLRIYGQANQSGQLVVNRTNGDAIMNIKTLEVHSAQLTATSSTSSCGGIYGSTTFNVYGGSVDAKCTGAGYGISMNSGGSLNIHGGDVKAEGTGTGNYSFGIRCGGTATVTVNGGKLWAANADKKALNNITLQKGEGFTGKIEYSSDKSTWSETVDANAKYVRVGY